MTAKDYINVLDSLSQMGIYVIRETDHEILYFNKTVADIVPGARTGVPCHELWTGSCAHCPLIGIEGKEKNHSFSYQGPNGKAMDLSATRILWEDEIPAFVVTFTPHAETYSATYEKVVTGNLTTDSCEAVKMVKEERDMLPESGFTLTMALESFADGGFLYEEDRERFRQFSDLSRMSEEFKKGKQVLMCNYRRNHPDGLHWNTMEVVPDVDYTDDNQAVMIYVKDVQDVYREGLEHEEINIKNEAILKAFGRMYFAIYAVNLEIGSYLELVTLDIFRENIPPREKYSLLFDMVVKHYVTTDYQDGMREFLNMDTLQERLAEKNAVSHEFLGTTQGWCRASFVVEKRGEDGRVLRFVYVTQEINQEKQLEREHLEELNRAYREADEANQAKSDFLFKMSHDIRTPLNAIIGFNGLIAQNADEPEKVKRYTERIRVSGDLLLTLLNEILDMTKIESGETVLNIGSFQLKDLIGELDMVVHSQATDKHQMFTVETENIFCDGLTGDEARISRTLFNILGNAVKYTPEGGQVSLRISEQPGETPDTVTVFFDIKDNGIGISPELREHVFEEFIRGSSAEVGKIPGTGLGLSIAKSFTELMGGTISVDSAPGEGSEFHVRIPLKKESADQADEDARLEKESAEHADVLDGLRVLVVEDNDLNREMISEILEIEHVYCDTASGGPEALELIAQSEEHAYDLIIMDVQMPEMDGYETTRRIRAMGRRDMQEIPIVALTANAFAEDVANAKAAGMNAHLAKPLEMDALRRTAAELLGKNG